MRLSHWFGSLLVGIVVGFQGVQFSSNLVVNWEFPENPNQVREPMGMGHMHNGGSVLLK